MPNNRIVNKKYGKIENVLMLFEISCIPTIKKGTVISGVFRLKRCFNLKVVTI